ncbi:hypothetical protein ABIB25_001287 [Nakamurella sp. UYEF19]|uniref:hypothetical protein n=1 Tax=Nakamurella sp. UYEF19 TaxID=1756392 RepID=UPI003394F5BC
MAVAAMALVVGCALVVGLGALISSGQLMNRSGGQVIFLCAAAISAPVLAAWILRRHPSEWTGPLIGVCVIAADLAACRTTSLGVMTPVTGLVSMTLVLLPAVLATRHPALRGRPGARLVIDSCFALTATLGVVIVICAWALGTVPTSWWYVGSARPIVWWLAALHLGRTVLVALAVVVGAVAVGREYRSNSAIGRSVLRPFVYPAVGWAITTIGTGAWTAVLELDAPTAELTSATTNVIIFLPAVLVSAMAGGATWIDLMVRHPQSPPQGPTTRATPPSQDRHDQDVEQFLSRALADPTIRVLYPADDADRQWIDVRGRPASIAVDRSDRGVAVLCRGDKTIGLVELDAAPTARPDAVELVATAAGLRMETESLLASARSDLERSRLLAARLLHAVDAPRAALRSQLLAGPLLDLGNVAADLGQGPAGPSMQEVADRLRAITARVRTISHGLFPSALTTQGLVGAINRPGTPDRRFPAAVEMTAYLAVMPDPGATIGMLEDDGRTALQISRSIPPEPFLLDRISALDGSVVRSDPRWLISIPIDG